MGSAEGKMMRTHRASDALTGVLAAALLLLALLPAPAAAMTCSARCPDGSTSAIYNCDNPPPNICGDRRGGPGGGDNSAWMLWYQQLEKLKHETGGEIARVKELQQKGDHSAALAAQLATLKHQMKTYSTDQATTEKRIKKRVIDLGFAWAEPAGKKPAKEQK